MSAKFPRVISLSLPVAGGVSKAPLTWALILPDRSQPSSAFPNRIEFKAHGERTSDPVPVTGRRTSPSEDSPWSPVEGCLGASHLSSRHRTVGFNAQGQSGIAGTVTECCHIRSATSLPWEPPKAWSRLGVISPGAQSKELPQCPRQGRFALISLIWHRHLTSDCKLDHICGPANDHEPDASSTQFVSVP